MARVEIGIPEVNHTIGSAEKLCGATFTCNGAVRQYQSFFCCPFLWRCCGYPIDVRKQERYNP
jgi:hypothetical protein